MMFSYRQAKYGLIFAIFAVGAIATVGIATTIDNSAGNSTYELSNNYEENRYPLPLSPVDGGGTPSNVPTILAPVDGGGTPS